MSDPGEEPPGSVASRDRIVVSTLRCGRSNPGSNPGHGSLVADFGSGFESGFVRDGFGCAETHGPSSPYARTCLSGSRSRRL